MIVVDEGATLLLVTQPDHASLAAEILSLWTADGIPNHPRRDDLLFATREHDNGWRETDAAPHLRPEDGRPHDFLSLPTPQRLELWRRGVNRFATSRPYASALIAQHALTLHRDRRRADLWRALLDELEELIASLLQEASVPRSDLRNDYRFLDLADQASLALCAHWSQPFQKGGLNGRPEGNRLYLSPFPLAGDTSFRVAARRIPHRRYVSGPDLGLELARSRWLELPVRLLQG